MSVVWRQKVTVKNNRVSDKPINILSISGSSLHFHCSFVEDKVLEASANTTFEVVFLSREEGFVEDTLYIHTNRGSFPYRVSCLLITFVNHDLINSIYVLSSFRFKREECQILSRPNRSSTFVSQSIRRSHRSFTCTIPSRLPSR